MAQDGRVTQLVSIEDTAWCNGTSPDPGQTTYSGNSTLKTVRDRMTNANLYTISIEHEGVWATTKGKLTVKQLGTTIDLIQWIRSEVKRIYNVAIPLDRQHIVGHCQISPINKPNCPGVLFQFDTILAVLQGREPKHSQAMQSCIDKGIIDESGDLTRTVNMETLACAIDKTLAWLNKG